MRGEGVREAREWHVFSSVERVEERLELRLIRVIAHVAAIEHLHAELGPVRFIEALEAHAVEAVVEQAAFAADEVRVKIVRLEAVDDGGAFADGPAGEAQERGGAGLVFVFSKMGCALCVA